MNNKIILLTKDALLRTYLPVYGNKFWQTPNIDALARKGTKFNNHYTAAPSTAMSFSSMFTGKYAYQFDRKLYSKLSEKDESETIFDILNSKGYKCHIVWSPNYMTKALPYAKTFGEPNTKFHSIDINQPVGPHLTSVVPLERNKLLESQTMNLIYDIIDKLKKESDLLFLWIHLPHVLLGRKSYGDDIDLLDDIVGKLRNAFGDESIYLSADHGHMNGSDSKWGYGFDLNENAIKIPLITPKFNNITTINNLTSSIDLRDIILSHKVPKHDYVISETAYYCQLHRKMAIIKDKYKYVFNKKENSEMLYDLNWDPSESVNLLEMKVYDIDRRRYNKLDEVYFYPFWEEVIIELNYFRKIKSLIWKECYKNSFGKFLWIVLNHIKKAILHIYNKIMLKKKRVRK
ncbi:sulfatase-like hydrolase/transferase [Mycoplasmatota bacterium WC30]